MMDSHHSHMESSMKEMGSFFAHQSPPDFLDERLYQIASSEGTLPDHPFNAASSSTVIQFAPGLVEQLSEEYMNFGEEPLELQYHATAPAGVYYGE